MKTAYSRTLAVGLIAMTGLTILGLSEAKSENEEVKVVQVSDELLFGKDGQNIGFYAANGELNRPVAHEEAYDRAVALCQILVGKQFSFPYFQIGRSQRANGSNFVSYRIPTAELTGYIGKELGSRNFGFKRVEHFEFKSLTCSIPPKPTPIPPPVPAEAR